jgi:hypothetical protein
VRVFSIRRSIRRSDTRGSGVASSVDSPFARANRRGVVDQKPMKRPLDERHLMRTSTKTIPRAHAAVIPGVLAVVLLGGCHTGGPGGSGPAGGSVSAWRAPPDGLRWNGRAFFTFASPASSRPVEVERNRYTANREVRVAGRKLTAGEHVFTLNLRDDASTWIVPPAAEIAVIGPIAWVKQNPDSEAYDRVDMRDGRREASPITMLRFFADDEPAPPFGHGGGGRYLARTLGMEVGQWAMIDPDGEVVRLIRDVDELRPQVEHDHATMLAIRKENPFVSFHRTVHPDFRETFRTLADRPIQPLRGGGLVVRHRTEAEGVFWSVYAADGSITIPATPDLVSVFAPVADRTSAARRYTRYVAYLIPLPGRDRLYWPILDDGTLLEAEGLIGIRPLDGIMGREHRLEDWDQEGLAPPWFATASLWDIGGQQLWALQPGVSNRREIATAAAEAHWRAWEPVQTRGRGSFGAYFPVAQTILTNTDGTFRLWGQETVYPTLAAARSAVQATADEIERRYADARRKEEEAKKLAEERARAAAAYQAANQWMFDAQRMNEILATVARIENEGAKNRAEVEFVRQHVVDKSRARRVADRYEDLLRSRAAAVAPAPRAVNWGTSSFRSSYGMSAMERESSQFRSWLAQREAWNRDFDRRWGFDKRR